MGAEVQLSADAWRLAQVWGPSTYMWVGTIHTARMRRWSTGTSGMVQTDYGSLAYDGTDRLFHYGMIWSSGTRAEDYRTGVCVG